MMVQGWHADDDAATEDESYVGTRCLACNRMHLVNPVTGTVFGSEDDNK